MLGLEIVADAIKDARANTVQNGVTNCEFFVGKAEDVLSPVIHRTTKPTIVAIVDPPRAGLRKYISHKATLIEYYELLIFNVCILLEMHLQ